MDPRSNGASSKLEHRPRSSIMEFVAKAATVGFIAIIASWAISAILANAIGDMVDQRMIMIEQRMSAKLTSKLGGTGIWTFVERELVRASNPDFDLTSERKRKIIADLRTVSDRWRPFLIEASSTLMGSPPYSPAKRE